MRRITLAPLLTVFASAIAFGQLRPEPCDARPADRDAIRSHVESVFRAFIDHDGTKLRATHAPEWRGYLEGTRTMIKGVDGYMKAIGSAALPGTDGLKSFKLLEFDCVLYGDTAIVPFVTESRGTVGDQQWISMLRVVDFYVKLDGGWIQAGSDTQLHPQALNASRSTLQTLPLPVRQKLFEVRERLWRAYFANERSFLSETLAPELIALKSGGHEWSSRKSVLEDAQRFAESSTRLTALEFPQTELQVYGNVAQIYSTYRLNLAGPNGTAQEVGRATETFVLRDGKWLSVGWHLDPDR